MNRKIDQNRMNQSREKTIDYVLAEIKPKEKTFRIFTSPRTYVLSSLLVIIALVVMITLPNNTPINPNPVTISAYESETIAEVSFLTSSFIGSSISVSNTNTQFLSTLLLADEDTEFEQHDEDINLYFDTLRLFLEDDLFSEGTLVEVSDTDSSQYTVTFNVLEVSYILVLTFDDNNYTGTLEVNNITYDVTGTLEEDEDEMKLTLEATNATDFVRIEYKTEDKENEIEHKYEITQRINGVETEKEVKVSREENEYKVEIQEGDNEYQLKKELEDGEYQYKLEYKLNGVEGEAIITESTDSSGNISYNYQIQEGDTAIDIQRGKPDYDYEEDEEDEEDEENNGQGNSEGKGNNQSSNEIPKTIIIST